MDNLEKLMKDKNLPKYTKKKKRELLARSIDDAGKTHILIMAMEEISELIEVLATNASASKINYVHTAEEIVDVKIMIEYMKIIFSVKDSDIKDVKTKKPSKKNPIFNSIASLTLYQQMISKYLRRRDYAFKRCAKMIPEMNVSICEIISLFKIKKKDMDKIESLKYQRIEERLKLGVVR
jgi:hypothetical protein